MRRANPRPPVAACSRDSEHCPAHLHGLTSASSLVEMWLLSTHTLELRHFNGPEEAILAEPKPGDKHGYAILSHVWARDGVEQTFADIEQLRAQGVTSYEDPRVSAKIRGCVAAARKHGFGWVWHDVCCMDKKSSAELDETINSMFSWYAKAAICFAYLEDVPDGCVVEELGSHFRRSRWFTRGWTLQELIAPFFLIFLSRGWEYLGTKIGLATLLEEITGIEEAILTSRRPLQHVKIMNHHPDHTLFAWGPLWPPSSEGTGLTLNVVPPKGRKSAAVPQVTTVDRLTPLSDSTQSFFAYSPADFAEASMKPISLKETVQLLQRRGIDITIPDSATPYEHLITSAGVRCHFIVIPGDPFSLAVPLCSNDREQCIALPLWAQDGSSPQKHRVGACKAGKPYRLILLHGRAVQLLCESGWRPQADSGKGVSLPSWSSVASGAGLGVASQHRQRRIKGTFQTLYIMNIHRPLLPLRTLPLHGEPRKLYIPSWTKYDLALYGLALEKGIIFDQLVKLPSVLRVVRLRDSAQHPDPVEDVEFTIHFNHCVTRLYVHVESPSSAGRPQYAQIARYGKGVHPQSIVWAFPPKYAEGSSTVCRAKSHLPFHRHVQTWENWSHGFVYEKREVTLSATHWPTPDSYCLEIKLGGEHYASLRARSVPYLQRGLYLPALPRHYG
ncbi:hypothetical protein C8Q77DRAFT_1155937 [Trametes polyzona]|nr:hypothetical protein C8Q77DRAFT_1155937 [Trametes polyzona]